MKKNRTLSEWGALENFQPSNGWRYSDDFCTGVSGINSREERYAHGPYRMNGCLAVHANVKAKTFNPWILKSLPNDFDKIAPDRSVIWAFHSVKTRSKSIGEFLTGVPMKISNFYMDEDIVTNFTWVCRALTAEKNGMHMDLIGRMVAAQSAWKRGDLHFCSLSPCPMHGLCINATFYYVTSWWTLKFFSYCFTMANAWSSLYVGAKRCKIGLWLNRKMNRKSCALSWNSTFSDCLDEV